MQCRPQCHLDCFEIERPGFTPILKDDSKQPAYFALNFLADRFGSFFSWADRVSSTGRARQIFRLTSRKLRLNS
jgi:hypothetical protein